MNDFDKEFKRTRNILIIVFIFIFISVFTLVTIVSNEIRENGLKGIVNDIWEGSNK